MTKILLHLLVLSVTFCNAQNWNQERIKGSGNIVTTTRTTETYDKLSVSGSFDIVLTDGKEGNLTLKGDDNLLPYIITEVENNKLNIHFKKNYSFNYKSKITIEVPVESISQVMATGSGSIIGKKTLKTDEFSITLSGSGDAKLEVIASKTIVVITGSGDIIMNGTTQELEASVTGSGDVDCRNLQAKNAKATVSGSGDLSVNCTQHLEAKVTGSGDITYKGKPSTLDKKVSGSGNIKGI